MGRHPKKNRKLPTMTEADKTFVEGVLQSDEHKKRLTDGVDDFLINGPRTPLPEVRVRCDGIELTLRDGPPDLHAVEDKIKKTFKVSVIYDVPNGVADEDLLLGKIGMAFTESLRALRELREKK